MTYRTSSGEVYTTESKVVVALKIGRLKIRTSMIVMREVSECAVNSAALSFYAVILCTALMQHIATYAR
jgi:hypothetical protein